MMFHTRRIGLRRVGAAPVVVDLEPDATAADLAEHLGLSRVVIDGTALAPGDTLVTAVAGATVSDVAEPLARALVITIAGPDAGRVWRLGDGSYSVGRSSTADLLLNDSTVSRRHATLTITAEGSYAVTDCGSRNGTRETADVIVLGATALRVLPAAHAPHRHTVIRRPRVAALAPRVVPMPPSVSQPPPPVKLDVITLAAPLLLAGVMAVLLDPRYAIMGLASPVLALASYCSQRRRQHRDSRRVRRESAHKLQSFAAALAAAHADARIALLARPDLGRLAASAYSGEGLWESRPDHDDFLQVEIGTGNLHWTPTYEDRPREISAPVKALVDEHSTLTAVPVAVDLRRSLGVEGSTAASLVRALVLRLALTHGPADVRIAVLTTCSRGGEWEWARWLPHCDGAFCGLSLVAAGVDAIDELVGPLSAAIATESAPWLIVVVDDASLVAERAQPARRLLSGARASAIVVGSSSWPLPGLCAATASTQRHAVAELITVEGGVPVGLAAAEVSVAAAEELAARLARYRDPEDVLATRLPDSVPLLDLLDLRRTTAQRVVDRWRENQAGLRIPIGQTADDVLVIDAVHDGPHALVAGTTGAGKSELLRSFVASLAATADAEHINFLLVDFKGGSAFDRAAALPHTVGVVTDLDAQLTERALRCLKAELKTREHQLRDAGFDNIGDYQRSRSRDTPALSPLPRLFVVVDEFAALAAEFPEFIDSLVDIGQRGRSLGVHIILATQRPAGVVKDSLRANANLRIALRLLDAADSRDVIGDPAAAHLSRRNPGRGLVRFGPSELVAFQTASITGTTPSEPPPPIRRLGAEEASIEGPSDLERLVAAIVEAHRAQGLATPRRPWPAPLPAHLPLHTTAVYDGEIEFGLADAPDEQCQLPARWRPQRGPLALIGLAGSGTTTALATVALTVAGHTPPADAHMYLVDGGAGELKPLADLPHCGAYITLDETERMERLWRLLQQQIHERKRTRATSPAIFVFIDSAAAFGREESDYRATLARLFAEGPSVGVHFAFSADRQNALGHHAEVTVAERMLFRLADRSEYALAGIRNVDGRALVAGRGYLLPATLEVHVARSTDMSVAVAEICARWLHTRSPAPGVECLPAFVPARSLPPPKVETEQVSLPLGLLDRTLAPAWLTLRAGDHVLVTGSARSGKSNLLLALLCNAPVAAYCIASPRSPLGHAAVWETGDIATLVEQVLAEPSQQLVLVDDADLIDDTAAFDRLLAARRHNVHVVAAGRAERLRGLYRHWTLEVRRSRLGVVLRPDDGDGELLGTRLPRRNAVLPPGRGWLIDESGAEVVQTALAEATNG